MEGDDGDEDDEQNAIIERRREERRGEERQEGETQHARSLKHNGIECWRLGGGGGREARWMKQE